MARKTAAAPASGSSARKGAGTRARSRSGPPPTAERGTPRAASGAPGASMGSAFPGLGAMQGMKAMTPEQAIELYKANAALALDVINAAIDNTARLRKKQFEGEEEARALGQKAARSAARRRGIRRALMAAGQGVAQEAIETVDAATGARCST